MSQLVRISCTTFMEGDPTMGDWNDDMAQKMSSDAEKWVHGATAQLDRFLEMIRDSCLPDDAEFYPWQWNVLTDVWQDRKVYRVHVIQSATGDGKTVISIVEILTRCFRHRLSSHKAFLAVPYRRFARVQGEELRQVFTVLRNRPPRNN
jgi:replicative superfamily II helicase